MYKSLLPSPSAQRSAGAFALPEPHDVHEMAKRLKSKIATRYDEAISFAMPGRDGLNQGPDESQIWDDTAVIATPEFASRLQQGIIPNFSNWASYIAGFLIDDPDELDAVQKQLQIVDQYLFELINSSNFQVEAHEGFIDLSLGTACMKIRASSAVNPFLCQIVPLRGLEFGIGPDGAPDPIYETRKIHLNHLRVYWPEAKLPESVLLDPTCQELTVIECWQRDWSEPTEIHYRQRVYLPEHKNAVIYEEHHKGDGCCEYIVFRWSKASGEGWGRGPLFNILPSLRKVNFAERALMDHVDMQLGGVWSAEDDGIFNVDTVRLEPGTLLPRAPGSQPLQNVVPQGDFRMAEFALNEARINIKTALYTDQLGNPNKTPMSAAEVNQRMAELARAIGSPFGRIILEFAIPAVVRFTRICKDRGLITMPQINGKDIKLICTSPLAQAQRFEDIDNIDRFLATVGGRLGVEMLNLVVDGSQAARELGERFRVPAAMLRPPAEQKKLIEAIQASQQGQMPDGGAAGSASGAGGEAPSPG